MPANYVLLERIELNASAASVTFANIPQTGYTDLKVVVSTRQSSGNAQENNLIQFNGTTTNYYDRILFGSGSSVGSITDSNTTAGLQYFYSPSGGATANTFSNTEFYIPNYTSSNNKSVSYDSVDENNATAAYAFLGAGLWQNTAAITSILLKPANGANSYVANSTFSLYGLAATGTTPVIAPKASGGNIIDFDGTYWIHTFLTSGTFTPSTSLSCDALVVAGGGGGGGQNGGGGGAGGFRTITSLSVTSAQTVTVGGGGANGTASIPGTQGASSVFSTVTSAGGGGGGYSTAGAGGSGGSGGGGAPNNGTGGAGNTPSTSPSQGNSGGNAGVGPTYRGGGGGGASAAGTPGSNLGNGNGGAGTANSYSGSSVTYAGGGGGGAEGTAGAGGAGGGGNGGNFASGTSGTVNLGGGAGGGGAGNPGGTGGSGVVIIRYLA
jgi:hypothetical protein